MDPELVTQAATTLVNLAATTAWEQARKAVVELWRRIRPERADALDADLAQTRTELLVARRAGDQQAEQDLVGEWRNRLRRYLAADPELAAGLHRLLTEELAPALAATTQERGPVLYASAGARSRIYQAGRDQHITER